MKKKKSIEELQKAYYNVFKNKDAFGKMFNNNINEKIILCPTDGYYLNKKQFNALMKTIQQMEDCSFYLSEVEGDCFLENFNTKNNYELGHWELTLETSYDAYKSNPLILENALYSSKGTWGVIISHEDHAVLGGSDNFMKLFKQSYLEWDRGLENFIIMCEYSRTHYKSDLSWLPDFLSYINRS